MQMSSGHLLDAGSTASTPYQIPIGNLDNESLSASSEIQEALQAHSHPKPQIPIRVSGILFLDETLVKRKRKEYNDDKHIS